MANQEKKQAAMNLLALRRWAAQLAPPNQSGGELNDWRLLHIDMVRDVMAELYSECFSDEQLRTLTDFYGSEMGKAILAAESEITSRFPKRLHGRMARKFNEEASQRSDSSVGSPNPWSLLRSTSGIKPTIDIVAAEGRSDSPWKLPARWKLEVRGSDDANAKFKAAIALDGYLDLVEEAAPYDREFRASRVIVLFESVEDQPLSVTAFSDTSGAYLRQFSGSGGRSGRIIFDSSISAHQAGSL